MLAYEWQLMVITKKAGLCKDMPTDDLKKISMATGIVLGFALLEVTVRSVNAELLTDKLSIDFIEFISLS